MTIESTPTTRTGACPSWCERTLHISPDDVHDGVPWDGETLHSSADVKGETTDGEWLVGIAMSDGEPATLDVYAPGQMTPEQGRALASAIIQACETIEGTPVTAA